MPSTAELPLAPTRTIGQTDLHVSPLCLGGNVFGWTADETTSHAVLDAYVDQGGNFIDTADVYAAWVPGNHGGESEEIIGSWLRRRGNRDEVVIATKVGKLATANGLAPATIHAAVDDSLRRLGTDHIDLYYAHRDDDTVPMDETLAAFDAIVRAGKVRYIAASNFSGPRLREALATSRELGLAAYVAVQNQYHLMERTPYEGDLAQVVLDEGLGSMPFYSLARGFLTGKYRSGATVDSPRAEAASAYAGTRGDRVLDAIDVIADRHGVTPASVALAWLLARPGVTAPIASARTPHQLVDLLPMGRLVLTTDEVAALDDASAAIE